MADRSDLRAELPNETKDNLFGPMCSGRVVALLATWALVGGKWFEHTIASPTTLRQSSGAFFAMDVVVSAVALLVFARSEGSMLGVPGRWLPLIAVLTVGVSLGLPLFLYLRERKLEQDRAEAKSAPV
jgi:hypothetical protein